MRKKYFPSIALSLLFVMVLSGIKMMAQDMSALPVVISPEYKVTAISEESLSSPIPGQKPTRQIFVELTRLNRVAYLFYWDGYPFRDLGPMVEKESWTTDFLDGQANITRTTRFMGREQEILVLHYQTPKNERLMIYSKDMTEEEFQEMLSKIRLK